MSLRAPSFRLVAAAVLFLLSLGGASSPAAPATAEVGKTAPTFSLPDLDGREVSLADYRGRVVVLEWFNPGCPFVKHAHGEGPLKDMARRASADGVVWLAVNSGAPGKQGHGADVNREAAKAWGMDHPILLDESGRVGRAYGAKTTPQMFVIDPAGVLAYAGGLDNAPLGNPEGGARVDYLSSALADVKAGRSPATPSTKPYGCSVKYGG